MGNKHEFILLIIVVLLFFIIVALIVAFTSKCETRYSFTDNGNMVECKTFVRNNYQNYITECNDGNKYNNPINVKESTICKE